MTVYNFLVRSVWTQQQHHCDMLLKQYGTTLNLIQWLKHSLTATLANLTQIKTSQIENWEHPWYSEYIMQAGIFSHSSIHSTNTSNKYCLYRPNANTSCFQKRTLYAGIKIFNFLPCSLAILKNEKAKLKVALRKCLNTHSFYSVDEFFMCKNDLQYCFVKCW
jgi:hypothetical protein